MEYEYSIAEKFDGFWMKLQCSYDSCREVKDEYYKFVKNFPEKEARIIRRLLPDWEFVDEEETND